MGVCECVGNCVRAPETIRQKRTATAGKAQRRIFALLALPESGHSMGAVIISHCGSTNTLSDQVFKKIVLFLLKICLTIKSTEQNNQFS